MDAQWKEELGSVIEEALEEKMLTLQEELVEHMREELVERMREELVGELADELSADLNGVVEQAVHEVLSEMEFRLTDGTVVSPRVRMKLLSPDKTKLLLCYGGLKVDRCRWNGAPEGWALYVQTRSCSWDVIAVYPEQADATAALQRVLDGMKQKRELLEL